MAEHTARRSEPQVSPRALLRERGELDVAVDEEDIAELLGGLAVDGEE